MKTIQVRRFDGEDRIFIDDQLFDWGIDENAINQINKLKNLEEIKKVQENIRQYFLQSIGYFLEREVTIKEVFEGIQSGSL